jgi:hypothetical protein
MTPRALPLALALVLLATACSEEAALPPLEEHPPEFDFSQYFEGGTGDLIPKTDVLLVRRPQHLERVYELSLPAKGREPGHAQAEKLFGIVEAQFEGAGIFVANQVASLGCAVVELPTCVPHWSFIEELLGPGDGPGARKLRKALADSFEQTARQRKVENTLVLATVNLLLTRGMVKSALGNVATAEARAAALAEHRALVEGSEEAASAPRQLAPAPGPLAPSPGLVQALTGDNPTAQVAPSPRLPQDAAVNPSVPKRRRMDRPIGPSPTQNAQVQADIQYLDKMGATNIRVNQQQLNVDASQRLGINRPDLQFDYKGRRYHVEYDTPTSSRGPGHQSRITSNDPNAEIILLIMP